MYKSKEVEHILDDKKVLLKLELKKAYEEEAEIKSYVRTFDFDKTTGELNITDDISLEKAQDADVHFLTVNPVEVHENSVDIILKNGRKVTISCEGEISIERHYNIPCEDEHYMSDELVSPDGQKCECTRIVFTFKTPSLNHSIKTKITHD